MLKLQWSKWCSIGQSERMSLRCVIYFKQRLQQQQQQQRQQQLHRVLTLHWKRRGQHQEHCRATMMMMIMIMSAFLMRQMLNSY